MFSVLNHLADCPHLERLNDQGPEVHHFCYSVDLGKS